MTRFAVVTPVRNAEHVIADTVTSIVTQRGVQDGRHQIDYVVMDGASTDGTAEAARQALDGRGRVISRQDGGMYDALASGWQEVEGAVYFYLNAGDMLQPGALDLLAELIDVRGIDWVCGLHVNYALGGQIINTVLPLRYRREWIAQGVYGDVLPPVQQETTFWSARLMARLDVGPIRSYRLAGDAYLWHSMARWTEPTIVQAALSGFRHHGGHLSDAHAAYLDELRTVSDPLRPATRVAATLERPLWSMPPAVKRAVNPKILRYSVERADWY